MKTEDKAAQLLRSDIRRYVRLYSRKDLPVKIAQYVQENFEPKLNDVLEKSKKVSADHVIGAVCKFFDVDGEVIKRRIRKKEIVYMRHVAMYLLVHRTGMSLKSIGELFGDFDHTTVIHAKDKIADMITSDPIVKQDIRFLMKRI